MDCRCLDFAITNTTEYLDTDSVIAFRSLFRAYVHEHVIHNTRVYPDFDLEADEFPISADEAAEVFVDALQHHREWWQASARALVQDPGMNFQGGGPDTGSGDPPPRGAAFLDAILHMRDRRPSFKRVSPGADSAFPGAG